MESHDQPPALPDTDGYRPFDETRDPRGPIDRLLRRPAQLAHTLCEGPARHSAGGLALVALAGVAGYGLLLASFSGGVQYAVVPAKAVAGLAASVALCLPSLYILACLSDIRLSFRQVAALTLESTALMAVLLAGFAPVAWIFSQSTSNVGFMALLHMGIWWIALGLGLRLLGRLFDLHTRRGFALFGLWAGIFVFVTLQMCTALRPLVGPLDGAVLPETKEFFLTHWLRTFAPERW
jgi:hypothetical protein